jgi:lipopolysaccharide transport system permease protein
MSRDFHSRIIISFDARRPLIAPAELWSYREVLFALVWREMKIRYAQTLAGAGWVILQPLLTTIVLNVLAGLWIKGSADGLPYALFVYSGLVPWMYLTHVLTKSSVSLITAGLLSKAYFPRLLLPMAAAIGGAIDMCVSGAVLVLLMVHYRVFPSLNLLLLPAVLLLVLIVAFGMGLWLAALNLYHRDVAHALPFMTQLLFFLTPVAYPISLVPPVWRLWYTLNPMVGVLECWRWTLFATPLHVSPLELAASMGVGVLILVSGMWYFSSMEPTFADVGET